MAKKSKGNQIAIYVIVGLICVAMLGFGSTQFGGTVNSIGTVGDREISAQRYYAALTNRIRQISGQTGQQVTLAQAQQFGLDQAALQELIATVAIEAEASKLGISVGDEEIAAEILQIRAFQGLDGNFNRESYALSLRTNGMTERQFEDDLRAEIARTIVQGAVVNGVQAPSIYTETLVNFIGERRNFTWGTVANLDTPINDPTEEDLRSFFGENEDRFMLPETRSITYAWLSPETLAETIEPAEDDLRAAYDLRIDEFNVPERRLVERLILGSAAEDARARLDAGDITFEGLVAERDLELSDIDLGDVSPADLGAAGDAVFATNEPGIVGPLDTDLGAALFRVNAILTAQSTSFEDAREQLIRETAQEEALLLIASEIDPIDDLLAGGATIEELGAETDMIVSTIEWNVNSSGDIADFNAFRQAALTTQIGDFPEVAELDDGGLFALRIDEVTEPRLPAFEDARSDIEAAWRSQATVDALAAQADALSADLAAGTHPANLVLTEETDITREAFISGVSAGFTVEVFEMEKGEVRVVPGDGVVQIVRLDDIQAPDTTDETLGSQREALETATQRGIGNDILNAFAAAVQAEAGISLDHAAINAVHVNIP